MPETVFENKEVCSACKNNCCDRGVPICLPEDFGNDEKRIIEVLSSKKYMVDNFNGLLNDEDVDISLVFLVRPVRSADGGCELRGEEGCSLELLKRPFSCRVFEPKADGKCVNHCGDFRDMAKAWGDFQELLKSLKE
jgi:hypothetical protein